MITPAPEPRKPKRLDQVREVIRLKHCSIRKSWSVWRQWRSEVQLGNEDLSAEDSGRYSASDGYTPRHERAFAEDSGRYNASRRYNPSGRYNEQALQRVFGFELGKKLRILLGGGVVGS